MAQEIADSKLIDTWGSSGTKNEPDISKIIEGWQLGEQPPHEYMNWLQNTFGSKLNHILKNGIAGWNNETEYLAGSSVKHNGSIWLCETTNTNSEPTDLNANWEKVAINKDLTVTVDTLADLRSISYLANTVWASGYHAKNDGAFGSHIFRLKGVKTAETDNGGTVIIATIGGTDYVYELQYSGAVNVKWFGAVGDYVDTDTAFTDNYNPIQDAIDFCEGNNINSLFIPDGNFLISQGLISRDSLYISGTTKTYSGDWVFNGSKGSILIAGEAVNTPMLSLINRTGMTVNDNRVGGGVEKLLLVGNHDTTGSINDKGFLSDSSGSGIFIKNRQGVVCNTVTCIKGGGGFEAAGTDVITVTEISLIDCCASLNDGDGVFGGFGDSTITRGRFSHNSRAGIVTGSQDLRIHGAYIDFNGTHGVSIRGNDTVVDSCVINYNGQDGVNHGQSIGARVVNNKISNHSAGSGIEAIDAGSIIVDNNVFNSNSGGSLKTLASNVSIYWDDSNVTLSGTEFNIADFTVLNATRVVNKVVGSTVLPAGSSASFSQALTGVNIGDVVTVGAPLLPTNQIMVGGFIQGTHMVALQVYNFSGAPQNIAGTYKLYVKSVR